MWHYDVLLKRKKPSRIAPGHKPHELTLIKKKTQRRGILDPLFLG
jgi:hypothetical protein